MGNMNIGNKQAGEWPTNKLPANLKGGLESPALNPFEEKCPAPQPHRINDALDPFLPMHPPKAEPCIGLQLHASPIEEIKRIRNDKGGSQVQALLEFKDTLDHASSHDLEKAQAYLTDELAKNGNNDDPLLGALLKAVNQELNGRNHHGPIFDIKPQPFPPKPFPPEPFPPHPWGGNDPRVVD